LTITLFRGLLPTIEKKGVIKLNIFYEYEGIFGKTETAHLDRALREFLELAAVIRRRLGKQGYLLDRYLSCILSAVNSVGIRDAADAGLDSASELRQLCGDVLDGKTDCREHPLYETVKTFIQSHTVSFQEDESRLDYYCVCLIGEFTSYITGRFSLGKRNILSRTSDIVTIRDLYRKISAIIGGEEQLERLNLLIRQRFLIVTPMAAFLQGLTTDLLLNLTYRDPESDKQIFQLVPDDKNAEGAL